MNESTANYIQTVSQCKSDLAEILNDRGMNASVDDSFPTLIEKTGRMHMGVSYGTVMLAQSSNTIILNNIPFDPIKISIGSVELLMNDISGDITYVTMCGYEKLLDTEAGSVYDSKNLSDVTLTVTSKQHVNAAGELIYNVIIKAPNELVFKAYYDYTWSAVAENFKYNAQKEFSIVDLLRAKREISDINGTTNYDFDEDGEVTAIDIIYLKNKLLGIKSYSFGGGVKTVKSDLTVSVVNIQAIPGGEVIVRFKVYNNPGIMASTFGLQYDSSILEYQRFYFGYANDLTVTPHPEHNIIKIAGCEKKDVNSEGTYGAIKFKVSENAPLGSSPISIICNNKSFCNSEYTCFEPTLISGGVEVVETLPESEET